MIQTGRPSRDIRPPRTLTNGPAAVPRSRSLARGEEDARRARREETRSPQPPPPRPRMPQNPRSGGPSLPSAPRRPPQAHTAQPTRRERPSTDNTRESQSSTSSSVSSSGSSLMERMKMRSARTSVEEEAPPVKQSTWTSRPSMDDARLQTQDPVPTNANGESAGWALWNRVAAAAGSLTVNASKAWEGSASREDGEVTPPGQDSHLTKVLKAYHLERARSPSDLPEWLFNESERYPTQAAARGRTGRTDERERDRDTVREQYPRGEREREPSQPPAPSRSALRDIYDSASQNTRVRDRERERERDKGYETEGGGTSKATSRLKAIRDAKRGAYGPPSSASEGVRGRSVDLTQRGEVPMPAPPAPAPSSEAGGGRPLRVGLPSGPGRGRR